jgi:N-acetylglucosamine-6-phosphate deacetylase
MKVESPGFFDLQVNGFAGVDFNASGTSDEELERAAEAMRATGVTRFLPTLITSSLQSFAACARRLAEFDHPANAGIHMEGPYISPDARGVHPREHIVLPSVEDFQRRQQAARGQIVLVTLAPELPGALPLIEALVANGVRVAIGHSGAGPQAIRDAIAAGATLSTHLGNGSPRQLPRHPNLIWEQLASDELSAGLIVDGHHLPPAVVKAMVRAKTPARALLVTDAIAAAGRPPGHFSLGGLRAELSHQGRVTIAGTDHLAGSALTLDVAVGNTVRFTGLGLKEVLLMASTQPARAVGREAVGRLSAQWDPHACRLTVERVLDEAEAH